jgi:urea transport system ATP-binding protein
VEQKLPFARRIGTDLRILDKGRLVVSGTIADLTDEVVHDHLTV